jgi:Holliday junction resolvase RusA-like endonuclease
MIRFTIPGEPTAQGRPRFAVVNGHARAYDPAKSRDYKQAVRAAALEVKPNALLDGPLQITVTIYKAVPKSMSKLRREKALAQEIQPTTKPDIDNMVKIVCDSLNKIIWYDDSQIVTLYTSKWYSDNPRVEVSIKGAGE